MRFWALAVIVWLLFLCFQCPSSVFDSECLARINSNDDSLGECDVFWMLCRSVMWLFCLCSKVLETGWIMGNFVFVSFLFSSSYSFWIEHDLQENGECENIDLVFFLFFLNFRYCDLLCFGNGTSQWKMLTDLNSFCCLSTLSTPFSFGAGSGEWGSSCQFPYT